MALWVRRHWFLVTAFTVPPSLRQVLRLLGDVGTGPITKSPECLLKWQMSIVCGGAASTGSRLVGAVKSTLAAKTAIAAAAK